MGGGGGGGVYQKRGVYYKVAYNFNSIEGAR